MDWKQFFAAVVASLAWPIAIVFMVHLLKAPLSSLLPLIRSFKYKDFHIDLGEKLEAVKDTVAAEPAPEPVPQASQPAIELARISPRAAVLHAWIEVEKPIRALAERIGMPANRPLPVIARALRGGDVMDDLTFHTFNELLQIRNTAVHLTDREVTFDEAVTMADMCQWLKGRLDTEVSKLSPPPSPT